MFADVGLVKGNIAAGKLNGLAVTSATRSAAMPQLPAVAESGVPGYAAGTWYGILAAAGTAADIVARIGAEARKVLAQPEVKTAVVAQGMDPVEDTPAQFAGYMREESAKWGKVIREANIKAQSRGPNPSPPGDRRPTASGPSACRRRSRCPFSSAPPRCA